MKTAELAYVKRVVGGSEQLQLREPFDDPQRIAPKYKPGGDD